MLNISVPCLIFEGFFLSALCMLSALRTTNSTLRSSRTSIQDVAGARRPTTECPAQPGKPKARAACAQDLPQGCPRRCAIPLSASLPPTLLPIGAVRQVLCSCESGGAVLLPVLWPILVEASHMAPPICHRLRHPSNKERRGQMSAPPCKCCCSLSRRPQVSFRLDC